MKFRRSAPITLISAVIVVVVSVSVISNLLFRQATSSAEEGQLNLMRSIIDFNIKGAEDRALARAAMIANLPSARELLAAQDRAGLLAEYRQAFLEQKEKYGVDQAQFHVLPATSFLRLHEPESFGDDLSKFRPIVVAVNRDQTARKGFAVAHAGPAIFGVVPVFDMAQKHIGSFEIGIAFTDLLDNLKAAYGLDMAVFIDEQSLKAFALGIDPGILSERNRVGKYIRFHTTNDDLMSRLVQEKNLNDTEGSQYTHATLGIPYGIVTVPLRNGSGEVRGMIVAARDFSASRASAHRSLVWQALLALFAITLLSGMILIVIRGLLLRPVESLTKHFASLSSPNPAEFPEPEMLCDELQGLAKQYEDMRAKQEET